MEEVQERCERARAEGKTNQELAAEQYQVTIELKQILSPRKGKTRKETITDLEREAQAHRASVVNALTSMGVTNFKALPLSNSLKTDLTMEQIDKIAKHPDVKIVRLVKPEKVTT
jgi:hypothetical protein